MKKISALLLVLITISGVTAFGVNAAETEDGIVYTVSDGGVTIEGFRAVSGTLAIPERPSP